MLTIEIFSAEDSIMEHLMRLLFTKEQIDERVEYLAHVISQEYAGRELIFIGILKGSFVFLADLVRRLTIPVMIDFARLASYGSKSFSNGEVAITKDIETPLAGRDVILVDDIVDSGNTLAFYSEKLRYHRPRSLRICTLIDKAHRREKQVNVDYCGFKLEEGFVVGYGLDFDERYRNLPGIYLIEMRASDGGNEVS